ncbi:MAG: RHS repeat-associated core domain-containing protein [Burkholderiaceae bacterium]
MDPARRSHQSARQPQLQQRRPDHRDGNHQPAIRQRRAHPSLTQHLWQPADTDSSHSTLAQSPATWSASYDRAGRLSTLTKTSGSGHAKDSTTYQYDPNGNLTSSQRERAATTTTRSYRTESGHNKLLGFSQTSTSASGTASTSVTHTYDAAGNLQSDGLHQYHYDSQGRLQSSQTGQGPDAPTTRYAHNALGQRVFKTEPLYAAASSKDGALDDEEEDPGLLQTLVDFFTRLWNPAKSDAEHLGWAYVYDEDGSLLGEYGMGGSQSAGQSQYIYLPTSQGPIPMAAEIDNRLYAIHTDHLGTPRRLTQADGQAAWQWAYSAYGDEAPTLGAKRFTNETTNPTTGSTNIAPVRFNLRYPGQYFDEESGLHYNWHRNYDPKMGRYTQTDLIGLQGGWNRYAYVSGSPLMFTDRMGLAGDDHSTGQWKQCSKGCRIRIDFKLVNGVKVRHLHWECKKGEGVGGEFGGESHGETLDGAPAHIKECARKYGFEPDPQPDSCPPERSLLDRLRDCLLPPRVYDPRLDRMVPGGSQTPGFTPIPGGPPPIFVLP